MTDRFPLLIDGALEPAAGGEEFESIDPSDGIAWASVACGNEEDAERAVRAARRAFDDGPWPRMSGRQRADHLLRIAELVKQNAPRLAELESRDAGHTIRMAKGTDIGSVISTFRVFAELAGRGDEVALPRVPGSMNFLRYEPLGVCAAITPWNFPIQMAAWKIAPAIAAGNAVIVKPATQSSITTVELGRLCLEAGIPEGIVNVVPGAGSVVGEALVGNPMVDKIALTGSTDVGRRIMQGAAANVTKVTLELGGKSASIVLDDADFDYTVDGALWAMFFNNGQVCSAGTRLLVQSSISEEFVAELVKRAGEIKVGPALDPASDAGPIISRQQLTTVEEYVAIGVGEGAEILAGGQRAHVDGYPDGYYFEPTILGGVRNNMRVAQEEIFGPVLTIIPFSDDADAVGLANASVYGLAGGVWSSDVNRAMKVAEQLRTGTVWINDWHMINPRFPFGGYKQSGIGREHGELGFNEYRQAKHIHVDIAGSSRTHHPWWNLALPKR